MHTSFLHILDIVPKVPIERSDAEIILIEMIATQKSNVHLVLTVSRGWSKKFVTRADIDPVAKLSKAE